MELVLNLAWLFVAGAIVFAWLRSKSSTASERRRQLIGMAVLIATLFPVISVSDDLLAIQSASEVDSYPRRHHLLPLDTPAQPMPALIEPVMRTHLGSGFLRFIAATLLPVQESGRPETAGIENRPPPGA